MGFTRSTFMGASLRSFSSSLAWNGGGSSQAQIQLVEDPKNGDLFTPAALGVPVIGSPIYFNLSGFYFYGLFQKWEQKHGIDGNPLYEVILNDPREILDGCQLIINGYNGPVSVPNLLNVYGFLESTGFGNSQVNEGGMLWSYLQSGLLAMVNSAGQGAYGGPLSFRGTNYSLNLNQLPTPPGDYRIGGNNISLLEVISQICEDGGCDFFIELKGFSIIIRTVSRLNPPPLGTISNYIAAQKGNVASNSIGLELRNEITSSFLVGGEITELWETSEINTFWGYDEFGNAIIGTPGISLYTATWNGNPGQGPPAPPPGPPPGPIFGTIQPPNIPVGTQGVWTYAQYGSTFTQMSLNASPIADIIGQTYYETTDLELRAALGGYAGWVQYMYTFNNTLALLIGLPSDNVNQNLGKGVLLPPGLVNDNPDNVVNMGLAALLADRFQRTQRMWQFLKSIAQEYLGRKFLAGLPFILTKIDNETLRIDSSYGITDAGYLPDGTTPFNLTQLNADIFQNQDGRYRCLAVFDDLVAVDQTNLPHNNSVVENDILFLEARAHNQIVATDIPNALIDLPAPLFEQIDTSGGDTQAWEASAQFKTGDGQRVLRALPFANMRFTVAPAVKTPSYFAVPIKSNILTYGPWYIAGVPGKVKFEQDPSLVPWNYGGFDNMNMAATARVINAITNMQVSEAGHIEVPFLPSTSLGNVLQAGGPNVSNIDVRVGSQGVTTTYRFQTYTPRFGIFSKGQNEKIRRLGQNSQAQLRDLRAQERQFNYRNESVALANKTQGVFMSDFPNWVKKETPHPFFISYSINVSDNNEPSGTITRVGVSTCDPGEALSSLNADDHNEYVRTTAMSLNGLIRPFGTSVISIDSSAPISIYTIPTISGVNIANVDNLDPWQDQNDIDFYTWQNAYHGLNAIDRVGDNENARAFCLRAPIILSGFGFDTDTNFVPQMPSGVTDSFLKRCDLWKTGPVDLLWNERMGIWSCHTLLKGTTQTVIPANDLGSGIVQILAGDITWDLPVYNWMSTAISGGVNVYVDYFNHENVYRVTAADCVQ